MKGLQPPGPRSILEELHAPPFVPTIFNQLCEAFYQALEPPRHTLDLAIDLIRVRLIDERSFCPPVLNENYGP